MAEKKRARRVIFAWLFLVLVSWVAVLVAWEVFRGVKLAKTLPDEKYWHEHSIKGDDASWFEEIHKSFADYRGKEWNKIADLREEIRDDAGNDLVNRYSVTSYCSSTQFYDYALESLNIDGMLAPGPPRDSENGFDCNLSFELPPKGDVRAVAVLIHGLSDSPYHMWAVAKILQDKGCYVYGLRLPGHGTTPFALTNVTLEDWYAATKFVAKMARKEHPDQPFFMGGFSTGGALCTRYALEAAESEKPKRLFLFAPAIKVDASNAMFAGWHKALVKLDMTSKLRWTSISPEFDPCKYTSFGKWGGYQVYRLGGEIEALLEVTTPDQMSGVTMHAFQSCVDATVGEGAVAELFHRVANDDSDLVFFDINHAVRDKVVGAKGVTLPEEALLLPKHLKRLNRLFGWAEDSRVGNFNAHWISNEQSRQVNPLRYSWKASESPNTENGSSLPDSCVWSEDIFALSHICMPIWDKDAFYGEGTILSSLTPVGEREVLAITIDDLTRLRYNPFFDFVKGQVEQWIDDELGPMPVD